MKLIRHYGIVIEPTRHINHKIKVKVKAIQRWILIKLKHHTFFNIDKLNEEINKLLDFYNEKNRIVEEFYIGQIV